MIPTDADGRLSADQKGKRKALPGGVARQIEGWVRSKRFAPGSRLPSERELAARIGTSRNVVREAVRILETRGVVEVRHGIGTFATDNSASGEPRIPVKFDVQAEELPISEIMVARRAVECAVVAVAARACDTFDVEELYKLVDVAAHAAEAEDRPRFVEADLGFHEALGNCTHNSLLRQVQVEITRATGAVRGIASATHDAMQAAVQFHREIAEACAKKDEEAARAVMLLHLIDAAERTLGGAVSGVRDENRAEGEREGEQLPVSPQQTSMPSGSAGNLS
jgi:GntR family transcriptional regulator, transcriptional repressor for pyruvate dehydrogenase complex